MRSWELRTFDVASLALANRPDPRPAPGEVLVEIAAVSLNYRDPTIAAGTYAPDQRLPLIPASDAVGRIAAVGEGMTRWKTGARVIGCYMQGWDRGPSRPTDPWTTLGSPLDGVLCERRVFPQDAVVAAWRTALSTSVAGMACASLHRST